MPVNTLIIRTLLQYYADYGDEFQVECPTGSGDSIARRSRRYVAITAPRDEPNGQIASMSLRLVTRSDDGYVHSSTLLGVEIKE